MNPHHMAFPLTRHLRNIGFALLASAFLWAPATGHAALISNITYNVPAGTFAPGALPTGFITGGTVGFQAINPSGVSTPVAIYSVDDAPSFSVTRLRLSGPSGVISFLNIARFGLIASHVTPGSAFLVGTGIDFQVLHIGDVKATIYDASYARLTVKLSAYFYTGFLRMRGPGFSGVHVFSLGNEVRTVVPEPGSGLLLAFGVTGLATAVRLRRWRK